MILVLMTVLDLERESFCRCADGCRNICSRSGCWRTERQLLLSLINFLLVKTLWCVGAASMSDCSSDQAAVGVPTFKCLVVIVFSLFQKREQQQLTLSHRHKHNRSLQQTVTAAERQSDHRKHDETHIYSFMYRTLFIICLCQTVQSQE